MAPVPGTTVDEQAQLLVAHFRMLRQYLMRKLKRRSPTFLAVVEAHESGSPHLHVLLRSGFIHRRLIKEWWEKRTGSFIVDIRIVKSRRQAASYVTKYISKNPARYEHVKRYWCSQDWDPPKKDEQRSTNDEFAWWESISINPLGIARMAYGDGATLKWEGERLVINGWHQLDRNRWGVG